MRTGFLLIIVFVFVSCNNKLSKQVPSVEAVTIGHQLQLNSKYRIQVEQTIVMDNIPVATKSESTIEIVSLDDIKINVISNEQIIEDEELRETVGQILSQVDMTNDGPLYCYSKDGKTIKTQKDKNEQSNIKAIGALMIWNDLDKLPNATMKIGEVVEIGDSKGNINAVTKYTLDKVVDNIVHLSYTSNTVLINEDKKMKMETRGNSKSTGHLEYDLTNKYYRLKTRQETTSISYKFESPDEQKMKSVDEEKTIMTNSTIVRIEIEP